MISSLPFGKHKNKPLADIPADYLKWLLREAKLSSGLRQTVADEMARRGEQPPAPPPPSPRYCQRCGPELGVTYTWQQDSLGRRHVRAQCIGCHRSWFEPAVPPFSTAADQAASPTAALDVLVEVEERGLVLESNGRTADFKRGHQLFAPPELQSRLRECRHLLGRMMSKTPEAAHE